MLGGDNDSLLRLVEIRDMMAGQGWFDLHQYRMGPEGGFVMHWSRLVDAPIAAIMLAAAAVTGSMAMGETVMRWCLAAGCFWPGGVLSARSARSFGGDWAVLPIARHRRGGAAFHRHLRAGQIDHHNVQLVLALAASALLRRRAASPAWLRAFARR